jgi:hypothetical protein
MKKLKFFTVVTAMVVIVSSMFNACKKDGAEPNVDELSLQNKQKSADFLYKILKYCSFNFENYQEGEGVVFEENVTDDAGIDYAIFITSEESKLAEWVTEQEAAGKTVQTFVMENGLLVGISWKTNPFIITISADFPFGISLDGNYLTIGNYTFYVVDGKDIEDEIIDKDEEGKMVCYGLIITKNGEKLGKWIQKQWDKGKEVYITEVIDRDGELVCWVGVSKNPK